MLRTKLPIETFYVLRDFALGSKNIVSMIGTTYILCKCTFSNMKYKKKVRVLLLMKHNYKVTYLPSRNRVSTSDTEVDFSTLSSPLILPQHMHSH